MKLEPKLFGALLLFWGLLLPRAHATTADDIQSFTLENGMKVMVLEDHSIPNANMYIFYKAGSRNERPGTTGISHFFEHMMFNGAKKYGPKMFDRTMEAAGGRNNAYTSHNITAYTNFFPAEALETIFDLEADRIANLDLNPEMVESERGVVTSERSTGLENNNFDALFEGVNGAAFRAHPYSWPIIGHASDIANWSIEDLQEYYKTYYAPNNAVMVIAGDVKFDNVKKLAKQYLEPIPAQPAPRKVHTVEPEQKGERRVYIHKPSVSSANMLIGWHVPASDHPDRHAIEVLRVILSQGKSARLSTALVDNQLATSVGAFMPRAFDPFLFYVYGIAAKGVSAEQMENAIIAEINKVMREGVSEKELQKAKNNLTIGFHREMATINGKADTIGNYEVYYGDYRKLFEATNAYNALTVEDIQRVAKQYLRKANRTVAIMDSKEDSNEQDL